MIGKLRSIVLDAPDIAGLSAFYTGLAGWSQRYADDEWVTLVTDDGWRLGLQHAPDHVAPRWPDSAHPQQAHLDLRVPDLEAGTARAVELGATVVRPAENQFYGDRDAYIVDPFGHGWTVASHIEDVGPEELTRRMNEMFGAAGGGDGQ